jgi:DNA-binding MarR family transcriptional regulator
MQKRPLEADRSHIAFLLTQLGTHAAMKFSDALAPIHLAPPDAGILRLLRQSPGISQQELARRLNMHASRLVAVIDGLEERGMVLRKQSPHDRRTYSLHLADAGVEALSQIRRATQAHEEQMCQGLSKAERLKLALLLNKIAAQQRLAPGIHPGYRNLGGSKACDEQAQT